MPERERKKAPDHRSGVLKDLSFPGSSYPSSERLISEYPRLSEESEKECGDKATQKGMEELYQKQYGSR